MRWFVDRINYSFYAYTASADISIYVCTLRYEFVVKEAERIPLSDGLLRLRSLVDGVLGRLNNSVLCAEYSVQVLEVLFG